MSGNEYDGWVISIGNLLLKFQAVDIRESHVQNQAGGLVRPRKADVLRGRPKPEGTQIQGHQEFAKCFAYPMVIIHDEHNRLFHSHCDSLEYAGMVNVSVAPRDSFLVARRRPSWASM